MRTIVLLPPIGKKPMRVKGTEKVMMSCVTWRMTRFLSSGSVDDLKSAIGEVCFGMSAAVVMVRGRV